MNFKLRMPFLVLSSYVLKIRKISLHVVSNLNLRFSVILKLEAENKTNFSYFKTDSV